MKVLHSAPSNIAVIKYMGKIGEGNIPANPSISWTLEHLRTFVEIEFKPRNSEDQWSWFERSDLLPLEMSEKSQKRFLQHFQFLKTYFGVHGNFVIRSGNNFPSDCGLASSASSFAALTKAAIEIFSQMGIEKAQKIDLSEQAMLSRKGSGSSCRSFFGPWCQWDSEGVRPVEFPMGPLFHQVIVIEAGKKEVSSSEAHKRVISSPNFQGRPERATRRLEKFKELACHQTMTLENWKEIFQIFWDEFMDMHDLFETSSVPFKYMTSGTLQVLRDLEEIWKTGDGPWVTMDAGANIHLLYRQDQKELAGKIALAMGKNFRVFSQS